MTEMCLSDLATVIRSKNAGPFVLTLDVFFRDLDTFNRVKDSAEITIEKVAAAYRLDPADVLELTFFPPAAALKISLRRWLPSADPGDADVFGAQQHVPLMDLKLKGLA